MNYKFHLLFGFLIYLNIFNQTSVCAQQIVKTDSINTTQNIFTESDKLSNELDIPLINAQKSANKLPIVNFDISPVSGGKAIAPVWMKFYPSGTYDPDGYIELFEMDMNGDGIFEIREETLSGGSYEFTEAGTYSATVKVTDDLGGITVKTKSFVILVSLEKVENFDFEVSDNTADNDNIESIVTNEFITPRSKTEVDVLLDSIVLDLKEDEDNVIIQNENIKITEFEKEEPLKKITIPDKMVITDEKGKENNVNDLAEKVIEPSQIESVIAENEKPIILNEGNSHFPIADAYVYEYSYRNWNQANFGKDQFISCGWHSTGGEKRAYLNFDLSNVGASDFQKAILKIYLVNTIGNKNLTLGVYRVRDAWIEGNGILHEGLSEDIDTTGVITWENQPSFSTDFYAKFAVGKKNNKYVEIDITNLVRYWIENGNIYGLIIKPYGFKYSRAPISLYEFYSKDFGDTTKSPVIELRN